MLRFPGNLTAQQFLGQHWQKKPLFMRQAVEVLRPAVSRNELAWLATLDDVESRIIFTDRGKTRRRYRVKTGPFDTTYLQALPKRNWTLLVHDVEKHLPAMRRLFELVPFIPDWRIDDLMISFAVPGGGVGPHRDNYDVFLCQGIGVRDWRISTNRVADDVKASNELQLLREFTGDEQLTACAGDVLYLPPGVAHWGTATRASLTYSIGMRAPDDYGDPDLRLDEVRPGYISPAALARAGNRASRFGCKVTELKEWLRPATPNDDQIGILLGDPPALRKLRLHGMARLAFDDNHLFVNGAKRSLGDDDKASIARLCTRRKLDESSVARLDAGCLHWMLAQGAFELPEKA